MGTDASHLNKERGNYWSKERIVFFFSTRTKVLRSAIRVWYFRLLGMKIGKSSNLGLIVANWPTQVRIGINCQIGDRVVFDYCHGIPMPGPRIVIGDCCFIGRDAEFNVRSSVRIGDDCLIAAGVRFIDHDHGIDAGCLIRLQVGTEAKIEVGNDVWIGANAIILKGVGIGNGAVVAAGAVVTRPIPDSEIWGGVPAKKIGIRCEARYQREN